jgi:hypothetical protein
VRRRVLACIAAASTALGGFAVGAGSVHADEPVGGCPTSFNLDTVADAFAAIDQRIYDEKALDELYVILETLDGNGDGFLCWKHLKPNQGQDKQWGADNYVITLLQDNGRSGRLGK